MLTTDQTCEKSTQPSDHLSRCQLYSSTENVSPLDPYQLLAHPESINQSVPGLHWARSAWQYKGNVIPSSD